MKSPLKRLAAMLCMAAVCTALACFLPVRHLRLPENKHLLVDVLVDHSDEFRHATLYDEDQAALLDVIRQADLRYTPPGVDAQTFSLEQGPYIAVMINPLTEQGASVMVEIGSPVLGAVQARVKPMHGMQYTIVDPEPIIDKVMRLLEKNGVSV